MNSVKMVPVILCGGSGTRLWPRSRATKPKPFIPLVEDMTLFEATLARCGDREQFAAPIVVTGRPHLSHVEAQMGDLPAARIIVEPMARNTAAAIALAALRLDGEQIMLVCPSDHHIADVSGFRLAAARAAELAEDGWLVSFGIEATGPETGFGYLERGEPIGNHGFRTFCFVEKPDAERAQSFIAGGNHAWNGGIFAFKVATFLAELEAHRPEIAAAARAAVAAGQSAGHCFFPGEEEFSDIVGESVDYAVMENTDRAALVPAAMGWSDIGSWDAIHVALDGAERSNLLRGDGELIDCRRVFVDSDGPRVSVIGLEDVVIVVDGNEVLVTSHAGAQSVGKLKGAANQ